jgi:hypothetical protein
MLTRLFEICDMFNLFLNLTMEIKPIFCWCSEMKPDEPITSQLRFYKIQISLFESIFDFST